MKNGGDGKISKKLSRVPGLDNPKPTHNRLETKGGVETELTSCNRLIFVYGKKRSERVIFSTKPILQVRTVFFSLRRTNHLECIQMICTERFWLQRMRVTTMHFMDIYDGCEVWTMDHSQDSPSNH